MPLGVPDGAEQGLAPRGMLPGRACACACWGPAGGGSFGQWCPSRCPIGWVPPPAFRSPREYHLRAVLSKTATCRLSVGLSSLSLLCFPSGHS